jgi:hypothetical protein
MRMPNIGDVIGGVALAIIIIGTIFIVHGVG